MAKKAKTPSMKETMIRISHPLYITRMPSKPMRGSPAWKTTPLFPRSRRHCRRHHLRQQPREQARRRRRQIRLRLTLGHRSMHLAPHLHPRARKRRKQCRCILTRTMILSTTTRLKALLLLNRSAHRHLRNPSQPQRLLQAIKHHHLLVGHLQRPPDRHELLRRNPWI